MNYYRSLAAALRARGASEQTVASALSDAAARAAADGRPPEAVLGAPAVYADTVARGRAMTLGHRVTAAVFAVVVLLTIAVLVSGTGSALASVPPLLVSLPGTALALMIGFLVDRRLPGEVRGRLEARQ